jgi:ABC-type lipoprotein release transport system permease subunit
MWTRSDLRRRWMSWTVLGVLAGISIGLACASIAGARRTDTAIPRFAAVSHMPDAVVLANDPAFDDATQAEVAALPEVTGFYPFLVPFLLETSAPELAPLLPTTPAGILTGTSPFVAGRPPDPSKPDEIAVNEQARDQLGLDVGSTLHFTQAPPPADFPFPAPPGSDVPIDQVMHVVGVVDGAGSDEPNANVSSAFYDKYRTQLVGIVNAFVDTRNGEADIDHLRAGVEQVLGHPVNVENVDDLFGLRQIRNRTDVEANGLRLFAVAVVVGAGALVGQALVRAVGAGAADLRTWRSMGIDNKLAVRAMVAPATLAALVGAVTTIVVAVLLSPRFPIGYTRQFELDIGIHADWLVLLPGAVFVATAITVAAWLTAERAVRREEQLESSGNPPRALTGAALPPPMMIGSRLAVEVGRGRRAVPVRAALIGAIAGVLTVVACLTFRNGLAETVSDPTRSGIVWDHQFDKAGLFTDDEMVKVASDPAVDGILRATWARAVPIDGTSTPVFGIAADGEFEPKLLDGSVPQGMDEIAFGPSTMSALGVHIGDRVAVGEAGRSMRVVGSALLPATSHTAYDQSGWITSDSLMSLVDPATADDEFFEDMLLLRWKPDADVSAARQRLAELASTKQAVYFSMPAELPDGVDSLRSMLVLPLTLAVFFAMLAVATVAHALATTVRRRRSDLAVLRAMGFTRTNARLAVAFQATLLAAAGVVLGVPAGIVVGRFLWKQFAENYPVVYAPPLALVAILLVAPVAVVVSNLLAVGPARSATRVRPAEVLRSE